MIKQKFKRALNGLLAAVMCVSTLTAVSYVQPVASADNGNEYYNPALRWLQYESAKTGTALTSNALVSQQQMHCSNAMCPSNRPDGYYLGPYLVGTTYYTVNLQDKSNPNYVGLWKWNAQTGMWIWANEDDPVPPELIGNIEAELSGETGGDISGTIVITNTIPGYNHTELRGDNTGTAYSRTMMTVMRVPEYTHTGKSPYHHTKVGDTLVYDGALMNGKEVIGYGVGSGGEANEGYINEVGELSQNIDDYTGTETWLESPRTGEGKFTGNHFTATYCQSCGVWNTTDPSWGNQLLNNGNWGLNECSMFKTQEGLNVKPEVTRTYGHGAHTGKNKAGNATTDNDIEYHRSLDNQQTQACMYCFGTQKNIGTIDAPNWVSLNKEEDMYLFNEHEYHDWGIKTEVSSPYTLTITKTCNGDAIADFGCGYTETNIYEAKQFVNDYIGIVDGTAHYPQGALAEASLANGGVGIIEGDAAEKTLTATLEWDDGEPPMRIIAGTATKGYTITYSFPEDYIDNKTGELTSSKKDADGKDNRYVGDVTTSVTGVATVTLAPTNMSYSNEGNKNYYNNNNATGGSSILSGLYGGLVANGWSGNVVTGGTGVVTGTGGVVATSALIEGYWS